MNNNKTYNLKFREFDYDSMKKELPEGCEPIPYLPVEMQTKRAVRISIHGFRTEESARSFIAQYAAFVPGDSFEIRVRWKNAIEFEYQVIAPQIVSLFLETGSYSYCTVTTPYGNDHKAPVLYRNIGTKYVSNLIRKGELQLSTFKRCRVLENEARRDKYELRNIVEIHEGTQKMQVDAGFDDSLLVLCTSLPPLDEDANKSATVCITDIHGFYKAITKSLYDMGLLVTEVLHGPCVYNDKVIGIKTDSFVSYVLNKTDNTGVFPSDEVMTFIRTHAENDIIMNKPSCFEKEREYRFVWKLAVPFNEDRLIIVNPDLNKYCKPVE